MLPVSSEQQAYAPKILLYATTIVNNLPQSVEKKAHSVHSSKKNNVKKIAAPQHEKTAVPSFVAASEAADESSGEVAPQKVKRMPYVLAEFMSTPKYTQEALSLAIEGEVTFALTINSDGKVADYSLLNGLGYGLDERALEALLSYHFAPALNFHDQPVAIKTTYTFVFSIQS